MIAEQLALYLQANGVAVQNTTLFLGFQPDSPDNCVTVYDETSPIIEESHALDVDQFGVQVLVRNISYTGARDKTMEIHRLLAGFGGVPFVDGGDIVHALFVDIPPAPIGRDDNGRSEWSAHYRMRVKSTGDLYRS